MGTRRGERIDPAGRTLLGQSLTISSSVESKCDEGQIAVRSDPRHICSLQMSQGVARDSVLSGPIRVKRLIYFLLPRPNCRLHLAFDLLGFPFCLHVCIARHLTNFALHTASSLLHLPTHFVLCSLCPKVLVLIVHKLLLCSFHTLMKWTFHLIKDGIACSDDDSLVLFH